MKELQSQLKIEYLATGVYGVSGDEIAIIGQIVEVKGRAELFRKEVKGKAAEVLELQRRLSADLLSWFSKKPPAEILATLPVWTRSLPAAKALYEGMDLYDQGRYAEAWLRFRQASKADAAYMEAQYWVGKMYYFMNRYEHARRAIERFVYLDTVHPRVGDAMVEYVHTYEATGAPPAALLALYEDLARRFPNANVYQGRRWGQRGDLRGEEWFKYKRILLLSQLGRHAEVVALSGPVLLSGNWFPWNERGCYVPFGLVSLMEQYARTGQWPPFKFQRAGYATGAVTRELTAEEGSDTWMRFEVNAPSQTVRTTPRRLIGEERAAHDRQGAFDESWATLSLALRAPNGHAFESLRFQALAEGDQGYLEVKLRRPDTVPRWFGYGPAKRADLAQAHRQGLLFDSPPRLGILVAECRFAVSDPGSGPITVKGVTVTARLARIDMPGTLDVSCQDTATFRVDVDGALARWFPGRVGPLSPGRHTVRFAPVADGTPYGEWSATVDVLAGKMTPVAGRLPWAPGNPWNSWRWTAVGAAPAQPDPSLWLFNGEEPAIQADDQAVRLVWSCQGDLWSSVSTDGERFSPPQRLPLPVSSGWDEMSPRLVRDESGRFVLTFLSCRDARHRDLVYVCWSRDFVHWSEPALVHDEGMSYDYGLLTDSRGRLVLYCPSPKQRIAFVSSDAHHWARNRIQGRALSQDRTGLFCSYDITLEKQAPPGTTAPEYYYRLRRWTSPDLEKWSAEETLCTFKSDTELPDYRLFAVEGDRGPVILAYGSPYEKKWDVALYEQGEGGQWRFAGAVWGLLPGATRPAYHPRWGYLMAAMGLQGNGSWPQEPSGPYLLRGADLGPLREFRNPVAPLAMQADQEKKGRPKVGNLSADGRLTDVRIGNPFYGRDLPPPVVSPGPVGTLVYVPALRGRAVSVKGSQNFRPAPAGCGTVHAGARVVTLDLGNGKMAIALDAEKADAQHYDVIRLDPTGRGDFRNAPVVRRANYSASAAAPNKEAEFNYQFGGGISALTVGQTHLAAGIDVHYSEKTTLGSGTDLEYQFSTCAVGECRFGDKVYRVRFYDLTNNLSVRDGVACPPSGVRLTPETWGDWYAVDCHDDGDKVAWNSNKAGDPVRYGDRLWRINEPRIAAARYGQPVLVDGRWWNVRVSDDGQKVTAEPHAAPTAQLRVEHPFWRMILVGPACVLDVWGGNAPVPVPAGSYAIYTYQEYLGAAPDFKTPLLTVSHESGLPAAPMALNLKAGTTTTVRIGSPLRGSLDVSKADGRVRFGITLRDAAGREVYVDRFHPLEVNHMCPVRITLLRTSDQHKAVYEAALFEVEERGWAIPTGMGGAYTVKAEFPDTFSVEVEPASVTIP
jgi:tetratricopeptide (TPR) repeat protein